MKFSRHWLWLLLLIPVAMGFMRLRLDVEVMNLLPDELPVVRGLKLYQNHFANSRELIITIDADEAEIAESAARTVALALRQSPHLITHAVWQPLWLEDASQSAELVAFLWLNQPPEIFGSLTNRFTDQNLPRLLAEAQEALTTSLSPQDLVRRGYDPLNLTQLPDAGPGSALTGDGNEFFSSEDGTFRLVYAEAASNIDDYRDCTRWLNGVREIVQAALVTGEFAGKVRVNYTGKPAFVSEISTGMQQDMMGPSGATLLVIAALFYFTHRRLKPLLWLTVLLLVTLAATMAVGGLVYGTLNIISLGFASILLGLAEDFGIVLYQESRSHPELSVREIRKMAAPGIFWSAATTCGAFLVLNLGGLPGLGQLGTLVAIGIALAAFIMVYGFLPPLMRNHSGKERFIPAQHVHSPAAIRWPWFSTIALLIVCGAILTARRPSFDNSPDALRPRNSPAYTAVEQMKQRLKRGEEPLWVLIAGRDASEVSQRLPEARNALSQAVSNGIIASFTLPAGLWPNPAHQAANQAAVAFLLSRTTAFKQTAERSGFTSDSTVLTENIFRTWESARRQPGIFWPTNASSRWILDKVTSRDGERQFALGLIQRDPGVPLVAMVPRFLQLSEQLAPRGIYLSGWEVLGNAVFSRIKNNFWKVLVPMFLLITISLWIAFRNVREMLLSQATLVVSGILLWAVMGALGWSWNLLNVMALPLLLGIGVDFGIHIQFALRRYGGDLRQVRGSIGRALLLAGSTTAAGFASLALSNNAGMASLGKVCGTGIVCAMLVSVYLLPLWWTRFAAKKQ
jgi:predicted RND superfamily exporter protein